MGTFMPRSARFVRALTALGLSAATLATAYAGAGAVTPTTVPPGITPARGSTTSTATTTAVPPTTRPAPPPTAALAPLPPAPPVPAPAPLPLPKPTAAQARADAAASAEAQALVATMRAVDRRLARANQRVLAVWRDPLVTNPPRMARVDVDVVSATLRARARAARAGREYRDALAMRTLANRRRAAWAFTWVASPNSPVYGPPVASVARMVAFARAAGTRVRTSVPLETLARIFIDEGRREGVRGDVAWAQSILETATFSDLVGANNFSGIGGCPTCPHDAFATARDGVRAQMQLLRWHADRRLKTAKDFAGQPSTLPARFLRTGQTSPTWYRLGGVWSPDPNYGVNVYAIYLRMLAMEMPATVATS